MKDDKNMIALLQGCKAREDSAMKEFIYHGKTLNDKCKNIFVVIKCILENMPEPLAEDVKIDIERIKKHCQLGIDKCEERKKRKGMLGMKYNRKDLENLQITIEVNPKSKCGYDVYQFGRKKNVYQYDNGYYFLSYYDIALEKAITVTLHRLLYAYFIGEVPFGMVVDHIDNDKFNNNLDNLQLLTREQNVQKNPKNKIEKTVDENV